VSVTCSIFETQPHIGQKSKWNFNENSLVNVLFILWVTQMLHRHAEFATIYTASHLRIKIESQKLRQSLAENKTDRSQRLQFLRHTLKLVGK